MFREMFNPLKSINPPSIALPNNWIIQAIGFDGYQIIRRGLPIYCSDPIGATLLINGHLALKGLADVVRIYVRDRLSLYLRSGRSSTG
ncbi:hypothetical protein JTE90_020938 [Oedothorax gibbosus]|uniref:Uncharacterized protein n=1 Tax=Oedothorax gibbosus TaxID=931172 RepID=A0AAV6VNQ6_9ARAC|nr:hypothetical protein JTE90_020938 [Oedothorax gibbosus]